MTTHEDVKPSFVKNAIPTGSQIYGKPRIDSDFDFVVQKYDGLEEKLEEEGFSDESSKEFGPASSGTFIAGYASRSGNHDYNFKSWRKDNVNVIVCHDPKYYNGMLEAKQHCIDFAPLAKSDSIKIHEFYLEGGELEPYFMGLDEDEYEAEEESNDYDGADIPF